jgi:lysozyme
MLTGFYHFYRPELSVEMQALYFCNTVAELPYSLKPVIDVEFIGGLTNSALQDSVYLLCNQIELLLGERPMIYTYEYFYKNHLIKSKLKSELFWIASYTPHCDLMQNDNFIIWQFSEKGTINGIEENVDLNVAKKSFDQHLRLNKKELPETK